LARKLKTVLDLVVVVTFFDIRKWWKCPGQVGNNQRLELIPKCWDKYHFINSFAEYQGEHNQF
jgi:hypothetical protein